MVCLPVHPGEEGTHQRGSPGLHAGPGCGGVGVGEQTLNLPQWNAAAAIAHLGNTAEHRTTSPLRHHIDYC